MSELDREWTQDELRAHLIAQGARCSRCAQSCAYPLCGLLQPHGVLASLTDL